MRFIFSGLLTSLALMANSDVPDPFDAISKPIGPGQVFYRWQSTTAGTNMLKAGRMTAPMNAHFMASEGDALGPGLYVANTPTSSASFLPKAGGNLIEVHFDPSVRIIDFTDFQVAKKMKAAGINDAMYAARVTSGEPFLMKYTDDWLVGKNVTGTRFLPWPGPQHSARDLAATLDGLSAGTKDLENFAHAETQLLNQVVKHRPDLVRELAESRNLDAPLLSALPDADAVATIRAHQQRRGLGDRAIQNISRYLVENPFAKDALARDPATFDHVADAVVHANFRRLAPLDRDTFLVVRGLALGTGADPLAREARVAKMAEAALRDPYLWSTAALADERVRPFLAATKLSPADQEILATRVRSFAREGGALGEAEVLHLRALAEHAGPSRGEILGHIDAAARTPAQLQYENACVATIVGKLKR